MGLKQTLSFEYQSSEDLKQFLDDLTKNYSVRQHAENSYVFSDSDNSFDCLLALEKYGFYSDRNRNYREFFGLLVEKLTGAFGKVTIEDF